MEAISTQLFSRYNDALFEIYAADQPDDLAQSMLSHIPRIVSMDTCAFFPVGEDQWQYVDVASPSLDPALFTQYSSYYEQYDLYKQAVFAVTPLPTIDRSSDYMDYAAWTSNPHRADFLLPNGMYHLAGIQIIANDRLLGDLSFYRDVGPDFSDTEMVLLRELQRHICRAFARCHPPSVTPRCTQAPEPNLTRREQEIAELIIRGMSNARIAAELSISVNTLKTHLKHVMTKSGCQNRTQLAYMLITKRDGAGGAA